MKKKGFTLIEIVVVVGIIALLATMILVSMNQSRKNTRINGAKTSLKSIIPAIIACKDGGGNISLPPGVGNEICATPVGLLGAKWPALPASYSYVPGPNYNSILCDFEVFTDSDSTNLNCRCLTQTCELTP